MKKVKITALLLALAMLWGCGSEKTKPVSPKELEKTVTAAMTTLTVGETETAVFLGVDGEPVAKGGEQP